ncbi:MAG TPA: hypothetical protein VJ869_09235 [Sphaerochaeta sp.]|nr:hypothetical protein [Sphaerochaeta sp.]
MDVEANYKVWKFHIQEEPFDLTVGGLLSGFYNNQVETLIHTIIPLCLIGAIILL